ncbi:HEPN domain-containing protein [Sphingopyxis sp.]|uniref:HEPN domain-containing protein n=1 Tax=Sphingopyxis sp. TaxID=1908224 RepID=UPI001DC6459D|nr:HEPN domain-containing protein [Sphingopyxis sp.]MBW8297271.1 HEPN domain-containing protein [Sphingopyxis sp.]
MKTEIDHLPSKQQGELERIKQVLMEEFARSIERSTKDVKRNGKILKIVLFGSYARNDWVDEPENGYQSDFDVLIIVSHSDLTDIADHWYIAEDKILRDPAVGRTLNIIVHTLDEVNRALSRGEYFWVDILRDGIMLYELPNHALAIPKPLTAADAYEMALAYFSEGFPAIQRALRTVELQKAEGLEDAGWRKDVAFSLHQAVERAYACYLLAQTFYFPRSHNIKFLRSLSEDREPRLVQAWPRESKLDRRRFELLKRAYVEARYSPNYEIGIEDLGALAGSAKKLRDVVEQLCCEKLDQLRSDAGL